MHATRTLSLDGLHRAVRFRAAVIHMLKQVSTNYTEQGIYRPRLCTKHDRINRISFKANGLHYNGQQHSNHTQFLV